MKIALRIIIIPFLTMACNNAADSEKAVVEKINNTLTLTQQQAINAQLAIGKIERKSMSTHLRLNGKIDVPPQNLVSVSVPMGGFLKSSKLLPGMHLAKGETIAIMEDQQYINLQQEYLMTAAQLRYDEAEYKRQAELNQQKAASDKTFQQAESTYLQHKISLSALAEKLRLIGINPEILSEKNISRSVAIPSPIDGYVSAVHVNIGKYLNPSDVLFELVNPEDIHLALTVFEKDINLLAIGQKLMTYAPSNPDQKYPCEIILIGKDIPADRSVEVHCHFEKFDKKLIPGMFMNAELEVNNKLADVIPNDAIVSFEGKDFVFVQREKLQYELVEISKGLNNENFTEIINAQALQGMNIVTKGAYTLLMKMKNTDEE